jgi:hypothetical protein
MRSGIAFGIVFALAATAATVADTTTQSPTAPGVSSSTTVSIPASGFEITMYANGFPFHFLHLRPVANPAWGLLCVADAADFSASAADAVCMKLDANNIAGYPRFGMRSDFVSSMPVYATALSCARGADFADCVVHPAPENSVLATRANCTPTEVGCVPFQSDRSATITNGALLVRYSWRLPYIPICGSTVNWNVAVAAGRQMAAEAGTRRHAIVDDVIVNTGPSTAPWAFYTGARVKYNCGQPTDADAPQYVDNCTTQPYPEGARCTVSATIDANDVRWKFAALNGSFVTASPRPGNLTRFPYVALSAGFTVTEETLEVACRSIGLGSSFFARKAFAVDPPKWEYFDAYNRMVDPVCDDGAIPALNRCRYRYMTSNITAPAPEKVLTVDCRVWPLWFLVTVPVLGALVLTAAVLGCVYCCRRHRAARRRRLRMLESVDSVDGNGAVAMGVEMHEDSPLR